LKEFLMAKKLELLWCFQVVFGMYKTQVSNAGAYSIIARINPDIANLCSKRQDKWMF
jgi:hypothetical protein